MPATTWMKLENIIVNVLKKEPVTKGYILYNSVLYTMSRIVKSIETENSGLLGLGVGSGG